ncbi:MAG TPA: hypothetical protein PKI03_38405 [Pseudomonadota bacterium]|nr:hypothetical protein [Pseudomonadota bacterium]
MIPFEEFSTALERYKLRRLAAAAQAQPAKVPSGKPAQAAQRAPAREEHSAAEIIEDL